MTEHGPSEKAVEAVMDAWCEVSGFVPNPAIGNASRVAAAAHDSALGLDRSVCLRDVVMALLAVDPDPTRGVGWCAEYLQRTFAEPSSREGQA